MDKDSKTPVGSCYGESEHLLPDAMTMGMVHEMTMSRLLVHTFNKPKYLISLSSSVICIFSTALVGFGCFFWRKNNDMYHKNIHLRSVILKR